MPELLTAKDVELKMFKKVAFGGYSIPEVEEYLNQIAEDLEAYVLRLNEKQHMIYELEEALKRHESMKDTIKDALILAQQSAKEKEEEARRQAELILANAETRIGEINYESRRCLEEAENEADEIVAAARSSAAQIIKNAEDIKEEAQKRLVGIELETTRHAEECKREMNTVVQERRRFLRESGELVSEFTHLIEEATKKLDRDHNQWHDPSKQEPSKPNAGRMTLEETAIS